MPRRLPPLNAVRAFEASARLGSFVAAAAELGVTAAAVSLQVRKLERFYGTSLFRRLTSGIELTQTGVTILTDCSAALTTLAGTTDLVDRREARTRIVVSCANSVAHRWLSGRLGAFAAALPGNWIELRSEGDPVDFEGGGVDIRITYGLHLYPKHEGKALFADALTPVATPGFCAARGLETGQASALRDEDLIETWWSPSFWAYPSWADWFEAAGSPRTLRPGTGPAANMPAIAIDMALQGLGVALGQMALAADEVASGSLLRPFSTVLRLPYAYSVITPRDARRRALVAPAVEWLMAETAHLRG